MIEFNSVNIDPYKDLTDEDICICFCHASFALAGAVMLMNKSMIVRDMKLVAILGSEISKRECMIILNEVSDRVEEKKKK